MISNERYCSIDSYLGFFSLRIKNCSCFASPNITSSFAAEATYHPRPDGRSLLTVAAGGEGQIWCVWGAQVGWGRMIRRWSKVIPSIKSVPRINSAESLHSGGDRPSCSRVGRASGRETRSKLDDFWLQRCRCTEATGHFCPEGHRVPSSDVSVSDVWWKFCRFGPNHHFVEFGHAFDHIWVDHH